MTAAGPHALRPVCMLVHAYYEEDARVRREAESLLARGRSVDVYALRQPGDSKDAVVGGIRVHRVDVQRHQGAGILTYLREYVAFFFRAGWAAWREHRDRRYALVHVHTLPDFLVLAALPFRLTGVPVILDLHEAMPEFFASRFPRSANPVVHWLLLLQERLSISMASAVVTVNEALADRLVAAGVRRAKITVVLNSASLSRFDQATRPIRPFMANGELRLVYAGALTPTYELGAVLDAIALLRDRRPNLPVSLDVYGRGDAEETLRARATSLGISDHVRFHGRIPIDAVPDALAAADIGLAPTRRDRFTQISLSTKIFEYGAMGKPIIASALPLVTSTFPAGTITTYRPGEPTDLVAAIERLVDDPAGRELAVGRTLARIRELDWEREADRLASLVERLARDGLTRRSSPTEVA